MPDCAPAWVSPRAQMSSLLPQQLQVTPLSSSWPPSRMRCNLCCASSVPKMLREGKSTDQGGSGRMTGGALRSCAEQRPDQRYQSRVFPGHSVGGGGGMERPPHTHHPKPLEWSSQWCFCIFLPVFCLLLSFGLFWTCQRRDAVWIPSIVKGTRESCHSFIPEAVNRGTHSHTEKQIQSSLTLGHDCYCFAEWSQKLQKPVKSWLGICIYLCRFYLCLSSHGWGSATVRTIKI